MAIQTATNQLAELTLVAAPRSSPAASTANPLTAVSFAPSSLATRSAGTAPAISPPINGQQPQAGSHGVGAEHALEVLRHGKHDADHGQDRDRDQDDPPGVGRRREQVQLNQRLSARTAALPALVPEEPDKHRHASADRHQCADAHPAMLARLDQAIGQAYQASGRGNDADCVHAGTVCRARLRDQPRGHGQPDQGDRDVDQEHPAPPVASEQPAAEDRPDRQREEVRTRPDTDCPRTFLLGEQHGERREHHHDDPGSGHAEQHPGCDERAWRRRVGAQRRSGSEQRQRTKQHLLAAVPVAKQAGREHRRGQDQQVAGREPLQIRLRGVQRAWPALAARR